MQFYVVDPKKLDFQTLDQKIRAFLTEEAGEFDEVEGGLYYIGDDVAVPWGEASVLFTVPGEEGGMVELRDGDRNFYAFADNLDLFHEREIQENTGALSRPSGALYGFRWNSTAWCRFHPGPCKDTFFFTDPEVADYPVPMELRDIWALFFRNVTWFSGNTSRLQDVKRINVEKVFLDIHVDISFAHPASLDALSELLASDEGYERSKDGLRAIFKERNVAFLQRFVSLLPTEASDFKEFLVRAVWRGKEVSTGEQREVFYCGVERRALKPFVQLPFHRTSKGFIDRFRKAFKGHRIDRVEHHNLVR